MYISYAYHKKIEHHAIAGEYEQNRCKTTTNCTPCSVRLPNCIGLDDGLNSIPWLRWTKRYISCYQNRTILIDRCAEGLFDPLSKKCVKQMTIGKYHS